MQENYSAENVKAVLGRGDEITFIHVAMYSDGILAMIEAETFEADNQGHRGAMVSKFRAVLADRKNRRDPTYKKAGLKKEEARGGMPEAEFSSAVSRYFAEHPGVIVGYDVGKLVRAVNKILQENRSLPVVNEVFDIHEMALRCKEVCSSDSLKVAEDTFDACMKIYARMERVERNKIQSILRGASYWEYHVPKGKGWTMSKFFLFFRTSTGTVYYDLENEKWDITDKERKRTGLRIENFDVEDILGQALRKYSAKDIRELEFKLKMAAEEKKPACAG